MIDTGCCVCVVGQIPRMDRIGDDMFMDILKDIRVRRRQVGGLSGVGDMAYDAGSISAHDMASFKTSQMRERHYGIQELDIILGKIGFYVCTIGDTSAQDTFIWDAMRRVVRQVFLILLCDVGDADGMIVADGTMVVWVWVWVWCM